MLRDMGLCQVCIRQDRVTAAREVDHILPRSKGGTEDESNLQAICVKCHKDKTKAESKGKQVSGHNRMGMPIDPMHHWNKS